MFVEVADLRHEVSTQEDRCGVRAIPEVVVGERHGVGLPRRRGAPLGVGGAPGEAVELSIGMESAGDAREQSFGIDAVVVRKRDEIRVYELEADVARAREAALGADVRHVDAAASND